jgi:hypothetical protein
VNHVTFTIERLSKLPRPPEYLAEVLACAVASDQLTVTLDPASECYRALLVKYRQWRGQPRRRVRVKSPKPPPGPGDVVKLVLAEMGYTAKAGCGCAAMQRKMNEWSWDGCLIHEQNIDVSPLLLGKFLRAAWKIHRDAR